MKKRLELEKYFADTFSEIKVVHIGIIDQYAALRKVYPANVLPLFDALYITSCTPVVNAYEKLVTLTESLTESQSPFSDELKKKLKSPLITYLNKMNALFVTPQFQLWFRVANSVSNYNTIKTNLLNNTLALLVLETNGKALQ